MTSLLTSMGVFGVAFCSAGTLLQKTWRGGDSYKSHLGRTAMLVNTLALVYSNALLFSSPPNIEGTEIASKVTYGVIGAALTKRFYKNIFQPEDRFESFYGRAKEALLGIGFGLSLVKLGYCFDLSPGEALSYMFNAPLQALLYLGQRFA